MDPRKLTYRLSPQQKALWPEYDAKPAYVSSLVVRLQGVLRSELLRRALAGVMARHSILRTLFPRRPGIRDSVQMVAGTDAPLWREVDLSRYTPVDGLSAVDLLIGEDLDAIFDLEQGPVVRATLARLAADRHLLIITMPSFCADSKSLANLLKELVSHYTRADDDSLAEDPVQYVQYTELQYTLLADADGEEARAYWRKQAATTSTLSLPLEHKEPPAGEKSRRAQVVTFEVEAELLDALHALEKQGFDQETSLLACWVSLLWKLTGESHLSISYTCDGRLYEEINDSIGLFARVAPTTYDLDGGMSFKELLVEVQESVRVANEWQEYCVAETGHSSTEDDLHRSPISFEYTEGVPGLRTNDLGISVYGQYSMIRRSKLKLTCLDDANGTLLLQFYYDPGFYNREAVEMLARRFGLLLRQCVSYPET
ncbi:MAG: condensation domain-containing protein, partial [Chloroflexia bacterium]